MQAARPGRGVGLGPQGVLDDLAMDRRARVQREQAKQAPDPGLGAVEQDAAAVDVEGEPTQRANPDRGSGATAPFVRAAATSDVTPPCPFAAPAAPTTEPAMTPTPIRRSPSSRRSPVARGYDPRHDETGVRGDGLREEPVLSASALVDIGQGGIREHAPRLGPGRAPGGLRGQRGVARIRRSQARRAEGGEAARPRLEDARAEAPERRGRGVGRGQPNLGIVRPGPRRGDVEQRPAPGVLPGVVAGRGIGGVASAVGPPQACRERPAQPREPWRSRPARPPRPPGPAPVRPMPRRRASPQRPPRGVRPRRRPRRPRRHRRSTSRSRRAVATSPAASSSSPRATGAAGSSRRAASRAPRTGSRTRPDRSAPTASGVGMATGSSHAAIRWRSRRGASAAREGPNAASARM